MKKFTKLLSLLFFLQVVWSSSIYGQVYSNDFSGGTVSGNTYTGTPSVNANIFSTQWTVTTGAILSNTGGTLLVTPLPNSGFATIKLAIKVKCGYKFTATGISFKHRRNIDGPATAGLKVNANTIATINPVPTGVLTSYTSPGFTDDTWGETDIYFDLSGIGAPATGSYELDDFAVTGSVVKEASLTDPTTPLDLCAGASALFSTNESNLNSAQLVNPVIHWQKNSTGADVSTDNTPPSPFTYTINPIVAADAGTYRAYVSYDVCTTVGTNNIDGAGVITATSTLTVKPNPTISGVTSTPPAVCSGGTTSFSASGLLPSVSTIFNYTVNGNPGTHTATTDGSGNITFPAAAYGVGTYSIVIVSATVNGCTTTFSANNTTSFTVNALPTPSVTVTETSGTTPNDGILCAGASATLAAGTYTSYVWSANAGSSTSSTVIVSSAGTYTVTVTNSNGCTASASTTITVNPLPTPLASITETSGTTPNDGILCAGASATLGTTSSYTSYLWSANAGSSTSSTVSVSSAGTYTVTVTDGNGCMASTSATITVNPLPVISFTGNGSPTSFKICSGAPITISTGGYTTFSWSVTNGSGNVTNTIGASNSTSIVITPTSISTNVTETITVSYTATDGNGCTTSSSQIITVNPSPSAGTLTPSIASPIPGLCEGGSTVNFTGTPSGGLGTLQNIWTSAPSGVLSLAPTNATAVGTSGLISNANPNPFADATVTYRVLDLSTGCSSPSLTSVVRVYNTPSTSVAGPAQAQCNNDVFTLAGTPATVGTGTWTVVSGSASITTATLATSQVTGVTAGTSATLRWTISNGPCTVSTSDVVLTNYIQPTAAIATSGPIAVCNQLTNFTVTANTPPVGTGVWSVTGSATIASSSGTSVTVTVTPGNTGAAVWTVTNGIASCSASSSITITNSAPPATAVITSNPSIEQCVAGLFTVNAASPGAGGSGMWSITNMGPGTIQSPTSTTTLVTGVTIPPLAASVTTSLAWTTSSPGCPNFSTATINLINYAQPTTANAGTDQTKCNDASFTLGATPTTIGTGQWTVVSQTNGTVTGLPSSLATAAISLSRNIAAANSTATLRWSTTNGVCPVSSDDMIIRNDGPVTSSITASPTSQCADATFDVTGSTPQFGSGLWTVTGGSAAPTNSTATVITVAGPFVNGVASANATWTVTNNTCSSTSSVTVINYETPTATISTASSVNCNQGPNFPVNAVAPAFGTGVWTVTGGGSLSTSSGTQATVTVNPGNFPNNVATVIWTVTNILSGCSSSTSITITNYALPTASAAGPAQIKCANGNFLLAGNTPSVGTGLWTVTSGTASITTASLATTTVTGVPNGTSATLVWTISNGTCPPSSSSVVLTNNNPITVTLTPSPFPKMCTNGSPITLTPTITGGTGTYTTLSYNSPDVYSTLNQLFNLQSQATLTPGAAPGTDLIVFTVVDNALCSASTTFSAVVVPPLAPNFSGDLFICGSSPSPETSTTLTQTTTGGSGMFTHSWVSATPSVVSLSPSTGSPVTATGTNTGTTTLSSVITYTVTDLETGCSSSTTKTVVVNNAPNFTYSSANTVNVSCFGGSNGEIHLTYGVGITSYTFNWSNNTTTSVDDLLGIPAGTYSVTITDNFTGCVKVITGMVVTEPPALSASITGQTAVSCFGGNNGSVVISATGGTSPYSYSISPNVGSQSPSGTFTGLTVAGGPYTVTVTDANSCVTTVLVTITQPTALTFGTPSVSAVSCNGGSNGAITVSATGGTGTLVYSISPNVGSQSPSGTFTGLTAQTYTVTVTDANTCSTSTMVIVGQPTALSVSATSTPALCNGGATGKAVAAGSGGTSPYTYSWSGGTADPMDPTNTAKRAGLAAATYTVTVTDANSCTATNTVIVSEPIQLAAGLQAVGTYNGFNVACNGAATGVVQATAFFGTPPYTYTFTQGFANIDPTIRTGLSAGVPIYVTVTDANGCAASPSPAVVVLTQPNAPVTIGTPFYNNSPLCVSGQGTSNNGGFQVGASGGVGGFTYTISPNVGTQPSPGQFANLTAQTYTVTATDANGCTGTSVVVVAAPPTVAFTSTTATPTAICSGTSTTLNAVATGGTISGYSWSVTASSGNTATAVPATATTSSFVSTITQVANAIGISTKTFTVTASNSNGCTASSSVVVTVNPLPYLTGVTTPDPTCPDGSSFGIKYTTAENGANKIDVVTGTPTMTGFTSVSGQSLVFPTTTISLASVPIPIASGNYGFNYRVQNSVTGCFSHVATPTTSWAPITVVVNTRPTVTQFFTPFGGSAQLCDANPTRGITVGSTAPTGNRTIRFERDSAGVKTYRNFTYNPGGGFDFETIQFDSTGTWGVTSITDINGCGSDPSGVTNNTVTITDARVKVVKVAVDSTASVAAGCSVTLSTLAVFNSQPSSGIIEYTWTVNRLDGNGFVDTTVNTASITLTNPANGWQYRARIVSSANDCPSTKFSGIITLQSAIIAANAGPDQSQPGATFTMTATAAVGTGTWTVTSGTATISSTTSPTTTVTLPTPNSSATLTWTVTAVGVSCSSSDQVVLSRQNIILDAKVFLEGPLSGGAMSINIRSILPATSPYGTGESSVVIPVISVTDWIKVELRNAATPATLVEARSGLLLSNGKIVDMDGVSPIMFNTAPAGTYHIAVIHRNHIDFRTNTALSFTVGTPTVVDFTIAAPNVFNTSLKLIGGTTSAMYAGDANGDNRVNLFDYLLWFSKNNILTYPYSILSNSAANADFNLNPGVNLFDYLRWFSNNNINKSPNP